MPQAKIVSEQELKRALAVCPAPLKLNHYCGANGGIWDGSKAAFGRGLPEDLAAGGIGPSRRGGCGEGLPICGDQ